MSLYEAWCLSRPTVGGIVMPRQEPQEPLATEAEAAAFLRLTPRALQARRIKGDPPPFIRLSSRAIRYRWPDLRAFVDMGLRVSTSDPGAASR